MAPGPVIEGGGTGGDFDCAVHDYPLRFFRHFGASVESPYSAVRACRRPLSDCPMTLKPLHGPHSASCGSLRATMDSTSRIRRVALAMSQWSKEPTHRFTRVPHGYLSGWLSGSQRQGCCSSKPPPPRRSYQHVHSTPHAADVRISLSSGISALGQIEVSYPIRCHPDFTAFGGVVYS